MILFDSVAKELYSIVISYYGSDVKIYNDEGNQTYDPEEGRKFYVKGKVLVSLVDNEDNSVIKVYFDNELELKDIQSMVDKIRNLAVSYNLLFSVKKYEKKIKLADFSNNKMMESQETNMNIFENMYGTSRGSYLNLKNGGRFIIKENTSYVENSNKERVEFNDVNLAKEVALHINDGGQFYDQVYNEIMRIKDEFAKLALNEGASFDDVKRAISYRISRQHVDLLAKYGIDKVMNAIDDIASHHEGAEELGSSDIGIMAKQVRDTLEYSNEPITETTESKPIYELHDLSIETMSESMKKSFQHIYPKLFKEMQFKKFNVVVNYRDIDKMHGQTQQDRYMISVVIDGVEHDVSSHPSSDGAKKFVESHFNNKVTEGRVADLGDDNPNIETISILGRQVSSAAWDKLINHGVLELYKKPETLGNPQFTTPLAKLSYLLSLVVPQIKNDSLMNLLSYVSDELNEKSVSPQTKNAMIRLAYKAITAAGLSLNESYSGLVGETLKSLNEWANQFNIEKISENFQNLRDRPITSLNDVKEMVKEFSSREEAYDFFKKRNDISKEVSRAFLDQYGYDKSEGGSLPKRKTELEAFNAMYDDVHSINESEDDKYEKQRGEWHPDYKNDDTVEHFRQEIVDMFDFEEFARFDDRLLFWNDKDSMSDDEKEVYEKELIDTLEVYLQKKLENEHPTLMDEDFSQEAKEIYEKEVKPSLEAAGYKIIGEVNEDESNELTRSDVVLQTNKQYDLQQEITAHDENKDLDRLKILSGLKP